jgi:hypothetical protein
MDMPAIHIPEFGKEFNFGDLEKLRAEGTFKAPEPTITSQDTNWGDIKAQADKALEEARNRAQRLGGQGKPSKWSSSSTTDNQNSNTQPDKENNGKKQALTNQPEQKQEQQQQNQQQPRELTFPATCTGICCFTYSCALELPG